MPGALIHILAGLLSAFFVKRGTKKTEFALSVFIGNLLPDAMGIIALMIYHNTINIFSVIKSSYGIFTDTILYGADFIILFFLFLLAIGLLLRHYHYMSPKKMCEYDEWLFFLLIGYSTHIIMDIFEFVLYNYLGIPVISILV